MRLHVNIDHVATLRQARGTTYPDPIWAAAVCELAGAHGITCHLREDRRHIQDRDVELLRQTVRSVLNLEMAATAEMIAIARRVRPDIVTLVPEKRAERTTEGGLLVSAGGGALRDAVATLQGDGIPVSLFIDPLPGEVRAAAGAGARRVELSTGPYATARGGEAEAELERIAQAAEEGLALGLHVAAGHGLDYPNVEAVALIPGIEELNIGHAIVARAVLVGLDRAVRDMLALCQPPLQGP
jgi:pyridoxine 5-phosphate synthase